MKPYLLTSLSMACLVAGNATSQLPVDILPRTARIDVPGPPPGPILPQSVPIDVPEVPSSTQFGCHYLDQGDSLLVCVRLQGASGPAFAVFVQPAGSGKFDPSIAMAMGWALLDPGGEGTLEVAVPPLDALPQDLRVELYAIYVGKHGVQEFPFAWDEFAMAPETPPLMIVGPAPFVFNPVPRATLDFDWALEGVEQPAGLAIDEQWAEIGIHVSAENNTPGHPDKAILFDSANPTGGDFDLATPGYGWLNDVPHGMLLIIPENDVDADGDGLVDDPDDEAGGGIFRFAFDPPVILAEATLIDVDDSETARLRCFAGSAEMREFEVEGKGDNCSMTLGFVAEPVSALEIELSGSSGLAQLGFVPCPVVVAFDTTTTGVPTELAAGATLTEQMGEDLGLKVSAVCHVPGPDKAILFDSANPTGDDFDLVTPGYHPTNDEPEGLVLIIAENDVDLDGDGLVDDPDDDDGGGRIIFDFEYDVLFLSAKVLDIDEGEFSYFEAFDEEGAPVGSVRLAELGDNSCQTVTGLSLGGVRRIDLDLGGSGALVELIFCRAFISSSP